MRILLYLWEFYFIYVSFTLFMRVLLHLSDFYFIYQSSYSLRALSSIYYVCPPGLVFGTNNHLLIVGLSEYEIFNALSFVTVLVQSTIHSVETRTPKVQHKYD